MLWQVKDTLGALQKRCQALGLVSEALHLTRLAGAHARPLAIKRITMYSAAWMKSQVCMQIALPMPSPIRAMLEEHVIH